MKKNGSVFQCSGSFRSMMLGVFVCLAAAAVLFTAGCASVGSDFPESRVPEIQLNQTTQDEIRAMFGPPWRTGIEDGWQTWTYGRYRYSAFRDARTKDLVIRFNDRGIVTSYTYNNTEPGQ